MYCVRHHYYTCQPFCMRLPSLCSVPFGKPTCDPTRVNVYNNIIHARITDWIVQRVFGGSECATTHDFDFVSTGREQRNATENVADGNNNNNNNSFE